MPPVKRRLMVEGVAYRVVVEGALRMVVIDLVQLALELGLPICIILDQENTQIIEGYLRIKPLQMSTTSAAKLLCWASAWDWVWKSASVTVCWRLAILFL